MTSCGRVLNGASTIEECDLKHGDSVSLRTQQLQIQATRRDAWESGAAIAAILGDGSVVTWGDAEMGGDCGAVQDQLQNVQQIQASSAAFAPSVAMAPQGIRSTWC